MNQTLTLTFSTLFFAVISGCSAIEDKQHITNVCSNDWYAVVEKQIFTGDGRGHGPDVGSTEWRSVVEFKLGIRGSKKNPPIESKQWCNYINNNYINTDKSLLGGHMVGSEVTELIQGFAIAKTMETTEDELMHTVFPHPTLSEMIHESVLDAYDKAIHI